MCSRFIAADCCMQYISIMYIELIPVVYKEPERWQKKVSIWQIKNDVVLEN
jgi:hypothetical protein